MNDEPDLDFVKSETADDAADRLDREAQRDEQRYGWKDPEFYDHRR